MENQVLNKVIVTEIGKNQFGKNQATLKYSEEAYTQDNSRSQLFSASELGKTTFISNRVDFIEVPEDSTIETIQTMIDKYPKARIKRTLSTKPVISNVQEAVLKNGLKGEAFEDFKATHSIVADEWNEECAVALLQKIAEAQLVKYGENNTEGKPADELVLYNGKPQYRITRFDLDGGEDIDKRDGIAKRISLILADNPAFVEEKVNS